jgi:hypothetical protein
MQAAEVITTVGFGYTLCGRRNWSELLCHTAVEPFRPMLPKLSGVANGLG